jgi:hypothetical protein
LPYLRPRRLPKSTFPPPANAQRVLSALAAIRESWQQSHDIQRAIAIRQIVDLGVSRRRLAKELGFSEGLLRHLLKSLTASPADLELAARNHISTSELVRRAVNCQRDETIRDFDAVRRGAMATLVRASAMFRDWLMDDPARSASALQIIDEARAELNRTAEADRLPRIPVPIGMTVEAVISRCRPERQPGESDARWYGRWAFAWMFRLTQNVDVCWTALDEASNAIPIHKMIRSFGRPTLPF